MAEYIKKINLDFNAEYQEYSIKTVFAKQLDENSRFLIVEPQLDGEKFDVRNCTVKLYSERPDKQIIIVDGEITDEGNIYVELTSEVISVEGIVRCDIKLFETEKQLSSCLFHLNVIKSIGLNVPEPTSDTDHEVVTIGLYQLNESIINPMVTNETFTLADSEIQPTTENAVFTTSGSTIQPITANAVVNQEVTVTQPETFQITMVSSNFEEDIEL